MRSRVEKIRALLVRVSESRFVPAPARELMREVLLLLAELVNEVEKLKEERRHGKEKG